MNIRYLNVRDNLHIHYIASNKHTCNMYRATRTDEITLRHYCIIKLHVQFISRNGTLAFIIKINKCKTHTNYKHVLAVYDTLDCVYSN